MKKLGELMRELRDRCLRCWAVEFSDIHPQSLNTRAADQELKRYGYPKCVCNGESRKPLQHFWGPDAKQGE